MKKKQREKLLDGLMGLAYSFAAISGGISVYERNPHAFIYAAWAIILMFLIDSLYEEE